MYVIVEMRTVYGARPIRKFLRDDAGNLLRYEDIEDALAEIETREVECFMLSHEEYCRPAYRALELEV